MLTLGPCSCSIVNLAWSPHIAKDLVFVCDDGYIGLADVTASAPGWPNDMRQTKIHQLESSSVASCSSCCWCSHPRLIYVVEGRPTLLSFSPFLSVCWTGMVLHDLTVLCRLLHNSALCTMISICSAATYSGKGKSPRSDMFRNEESLKQPPEMIPRKQLKRSIFSLCLVIRYKIIAPGLAHVKPITSLLSGPSET